MQLKSNHMKAVCSTCIGKIDKRLIFYFRPLRFKIDIFRKSIKTTGNSKKALNTVKQYKLRDNLISCIVSVSRLY